MPPKASRSSARQAEKRSQQQNLKKPAAVVPAGPVPLPPGAVSSALAGVAHRPPPAFAPLYGTDPSAPTIFAAHGLLSAAECDALLRVLVATAAPARVAHGATRSVAWRDVDRAELRAPELGDTLWGRAGLRAAMADAVPPPPGTRWAGLHTKWRVYRYREGQGFGPHFDEEDVDPTTHLRSHYTLLLYCSAVGSGGETVFYRSKGREAVSVSPEPGLVVVHAQGANCLLHEGRPVGRGGDKWVLRSDVMIEPE